MSSGKPGHFLPDKPTNKINSALVDKSFQTDMGFPFLVCPCLLYYPKIALILIFAVRNVPVVKNALFA
jgi:hypothetical protein